MPRISIITPAYVPSSAYLTETIASVQKQDLPDGWDLEWLVQEDGAAPSLAHHFSHLNYVRYEANGAQLGIAATRNYALARATGGLIRVLDSDDILLPGALSSLIPHFDNPAVHWAVGQADDLLADGQRVSWDSLLPFGLVPPGKVNRVAEEKGGNWPIHCAGLVLRTSSLRAIGGWAGLPNDEDLIMFSALSEITSGYNDPGVTWLYRQHPNQATRSPAWRTRNVTSRQVALLRARAVRASGLTLTADPRTTGRGDGTEENVQSLLGVGPAEKDVRAASA